MLLLTLGLVVVAALLVELVMVRMVPARWPWFRWSTMPSLGAFVSGVWPMGLLPQAFWLDFYLSVGLGTLMASLVSMGVIFTYDFWLGPSPEELARSGQRSVYLQGVGLGAHRPQPESPYRHAAAPKRAMDPGRVTVHQRAPPVRRVAPSAVKSARETRAWTPGPRA